MGTIKLEFDLPNFDKELKIEITVLKDGEVVYTASPTPKKEEEEEKPVLDNIVEKKSSKKPPGGNFMGIDI